MASKGQNKDSNTPKKGEQGSGGGKSGGGGGQKNSGRSGKAS